MTNIEKLIAIRAKCVELLEIASKRTPGVWIRSSKFATHIICKASKNHGNLVCDCADSTPDLSQHGPDANFIASCAGAAEAACQTTIVAIDSYLFQKRNNQGGALSDYNAREKEVNAILTAWEGVV